MNRQTKRMMDRRGRGNENEDDMALDADEVVPAATDRVRGSRPNPLQFMREVRDELRQVAWPTRSELVNYTTVVFFTLVLMSALIFLLNFAFGKGVLFMFQK